MQLLKSDKDFTRNKGTVQWGSLSNEGITSFYLDLCADFTTKKSAWWLSMILELSDESRHQLSMIKQR